MSAGRAVRIWMIVLVAACYVIQGELVNLLFPWVISPLIVAWLWLKHAQTLASHRSFAAILGFIAGSSAALLYWHGVWLCQGSVNTDTLSLTNMNFVITPLWAFALGTLGAFIGHSVQRFRGSCCTK